MFEDLKFEIFSELDIKTDDIVCVCACLFVCFCFLVMYNLKERVGDCLRATITFFSALFFFMWFKGLSQYYEHNK